MSKPWYSVTVTSSVLNLSQILELTNYEVRNQECTHSISTFHPFHTHFNRGIQVDHTVGSQQFLNSVWFKVVIVSSSCNAQTYRFRNQSLRVVLTWSGKESHFYHSIHKNKITKRRTFKDHSLTYKIWYTGKLSQILKVGFSGVQNGKPTDTETTTASHPHSPYTSRILWQVRAELSPACSVQCDEALNASTVAGGPEPHLVS